MSQFKLSMSVPVAALVLLLGGLGAWPNVFGESGFPQNREPQVKPKTPPAEPRATDSALRRQLKHDSQVKAIAFVPQLNRVLTLDCDGRFCSWDPKSGAEEFKSDPAVPDVGSRSLFDFTYCSPLTVSPDGRLAAYCGDDSGYGYIQLYDVRQLKKIGDVEPLKQRSGVTALAFTTRADRLAAAISWSGAFQCSVSDSKLLTPLKSAALPMDPASPHVNPALAVANLRGDDTIGVGLFHTHSITFYNARNGEEVAEISLPGQQAKLGRAVSSPRQVALSPDGGLLLVVCRNPDSNELFHPEDMITLWDATTGRHVWTFTHEKLHVGQAAFSPDARYLAVSFLNDPVVRLYRIADKKEIASFKGHTKGVSCIAFSSDGTMIASGSLDKTAIVWNVKDGLLAPAERPKADKDYAKCWDTLKGGRPLEAAEAVAALAAAGDDAVRWLDDKLSPVNKPDAKRVQKLLAQLEDNDGDKRDAASRELGLLGVQVEAEIKKALEGSPQAEAKRRLKDLQDALRSPFVFDPDAVRAVYVLERIGSERATALLKKVTAGDPKARLTCEAKISLERLDVRKAAAEKK